jgi:predicted P-loop ATPase
MMSFVRAVTGHHSDLDIAVLKHFVWQVKRKLYEAEVEHHLMPIFCGSQQGTGKSVAVRKLLRPIQQFKDEPTNLAIVGDERQAFRFARSFVLFFDEMAKATKADMESFKNIITQPRASWRSLGSNRRRVETNRATCIGTSNYPLASIIVDPTGSRRFYELPCSDRMDWSAINAIDYTRLWQSVDENGPAPITPVLNDLRAWQARGALPLRTDR